MYIPHPSYPTPQHEAAAKRLAEFFTGRSGVEAVLLTCSVARGKASADSCLDMAVLLRPEVPAEQRQELERAWEQAYASERAFAEIRRVGMYTQVDLEFHDGRFDPPAHGWTTGADEFELGIGNLLAYSVPLWEGGSYYTELKQTWLPYYPEALRLERLEMARRFCLNNLNHIPPYIQRGLYFQSFNRLYHALGEFLQALFIAHSVYPIAYDKWIREQVVEILGLAELYPRLTQLLEIEHFESGEIGEKAEALRELLEQYVPRTWYHGSPLKLETLRAGSTITQERELARVFSHKPPIVALDGQPGVYSFQHNGAEAGLLYTVEGVRPEDVYPHPRTSMPAGLEYLTRRDLPLRLLGPVEIRPDELLSEKMVQELLTANNRR